MSLDKLDKTSYLSCLSALDKMDRLPICPVCLSEKILLLDRQIGDRHRDKTGQNFLFVLSVRFGQNGQTSYLSCLSFGKNPTFGQTNRGQTPRQNWTKLPICPVCPVKIRWKNSEIWTDK